MVSAINMRSFLREGGRNGMKVEGASMDVGSDEAWSEEYCRGTDP